jgi:uncharacterized protein with PQ loop repeat
MKDVTRLRIINTIGCATWIAYGVMLDSYPVIITNVGILAINGGHLLRSYLNNRKPKCTHQNVVEIHRSYQDGYVKTMCEDCRELFYEDI